MRTGQSNPTGWLFSFVSSQAFFFFFLDIFSSVDSVEWDEKIKLHWHCVKDMRQNSPSDRLKLGPRPAGALSRGEKHARCHPAFDLMCGASKISWQAGSLPEVERITLKTLSHAVWHSVHSMFYYPGFSGIFAERQPPHAGNRKDQIDTERTIMGEKKKKKKDSCENKISWPKIWLYVFFSSLHKYK